jgi:hypothetical protein
MNVPTVKLPISGGASVTPSRRQRDDLGAVRQVSNHHRATGVWNRGSYLPATVVARALYGLGPESGRHEVQGGLRAGSGGGADRPGLRTGGSGGVMGRVPRGVGPQHGGGVDFSTGLGTLHSNGMGSTPPLCGGDDAEWSLPSSWVARRTQCGREAAASRRRLPPASAGSCLVGAFTRESRARFVRTICSRDS